MAAGGGRLAAFGRKRPSGLGFKRGLHGKDEGATRMHLGTLDGVPRPGGGGWRCRAVAVAELSRGIARASRYGIEGKGLVSMLTSTRSFGSGRGRWIVGGVAR
jgi:hypothetical protein